MNLSTFDALKKLSATDNKGIRLEGALLKKYQSFLLEIAHDIIEVCEEEHITYQLSGGSCLGAVRHNGFIPWDDDIDINILADDVRKFAVCMRRKYGNKYWVGTPYDDNYESLISTVKMKDTIARGFDMPNDDECGICVDLFPMVNTYDNAVLRNLHGFLCMVCGFALSCRRFYSNRNTLHKLINDDKELMKAYRVKVSIGFLLSFLSSKKWVNLTNACYTGCKNSNSKYISIPAGRKHFFGELYLREGMTETVLHAFEQYQWRIPRHFDDYLKKLYGDYMQIPPESKRETHIRTELKFPGEKPMKAGEV